MALAESGIDVRLGSGVTAAEECFAIREARPLAQRR
jgi:hypothetical protein